MSTPWSETLYPYGAPVGIAPGSAITSDLQISKNNPGVEFVGSEANAIFQETREIAGDHWFAQNASYAATGFVGQWKQSNSAAASYALVIRADGTIQRFSAAAGAATPIVWVGAPVYINAPAGATTDVFDVAINGVVNTWIDSGGRLRTLGLSVLPTALTGTALSVITPNGSSGFPFSAAPGNAFALAFTIDSTGQVNVGSGLLTFTNVGTATLTSNATNLTPAFTLTTATLTTGNLLNLQLSGVTKFSIQNNGIPTWTGALGIAQGGTGSTTQSFVDLTTAQTVGGAKTFTAAHTIADATDTTKKALFSASAIATATTQTFTFPNVSGTFITSGDTGTVTNLMLAGGIAQSKLAAFAGVNVGGPLTGATTGSFSGLVTSSVGGGTYQIKLPAPTFGGGTGFIGLYGGSGTTAFGIDNFAVANLTTLDTSGNWTASSYRAVGAAPVVAASQIGYGGTTSTTVGAAGGAAALPATPTGYIIVNVGGTTARIPYYN